MRDSFNGTAAKYGKTDSLSPCAARRVAAAKRMCGETNK
jgi:hypothetical protein